MFWLGIKLLASRAARKKGAASALILYHTLMSESDAESSTELDEMITELSGSSDFDWGAPDLDDDAGEVIDVVRITIGGTPMALDGRFVREILSVVDITSVPGTPEYVAGIAVVKRQVLGILDLSSWLGLDELNKDEFNRIVVLDNKEITAGVIVDSVDGIESWPEAIDPASIPETFSDEVRRYTMAARWAPGGVLILLDVEKLLDQATVR